MAELLDDSLTINRLCEAAGAHRLPVLAGMAPTGDPQEPAGSAYISQMLIGPDASITGQ